MSPWWPERLEPDCEYLWAAPGKFMRLKIRFEISISDGSAYVIWNPPSEFYRYLLESTVPDYPSP